MDHADHVNLIRGAIAPKTATLWADLGSGTGAFTLALADLLPAGSSIYSIDQEARSLAIQHRSLIHQFPAAIVHQLHADFKGPLDLPPLDGLLMANSLHFVKDKHKLLIHLRTLLKPTGRFVLVEYDTDRRNHWVPYPLSFSTWVVLAGEAGFTSTRKIVAQPSRFLGSIFSAVST